MANVQGIFTRLSILVVGVFFGLILFFPMGMMSDSGTTLAVTVSTIGSFGCLFLMIGGIVGAVRKEWRALVPGTVLLLTLFTPAVPPFAIVSILLVYYCCWKKQTDEHTELLVDDENSGEIDSHIGVQKKYEDDSFHDNTIQIPV